MPSQSYSSERLETGSAKSEGMCGGICTVKRLAILAVICLVIFAVAVGVAVGVSNSSGSKSNDDMGKKPWASMRNASLADRVRVAKEILDMYPLVDG